MTQQPPAGPYGNDPYGAQYQQGPPPSGGKGLAIAALVLGILALLFSWTVIGGILFGLIAFVLGLIALSKTTKGRAGGRGMAIAGIVLAVVSMIIAGALVFLGASLLNSDEAQQLQSCLDAAGQDRAAIAECERRFESDFMDRFGG